MVADTTDQQKQLPEKSWFSGMAKMKVVGIVGSPRINGNTEIVTANCLRAIAEEGLETELVRLAGLDIRSCDACYKCREEEMCSRQDDLFDIYLKMKQADGIILASPVYSGSVTALITALLERVGQVAWFHAQPFRDKVGGSLVVQGRVGGLFTSAQLSNWLQLMGVIMPATDRWNIAFGWEPGEVRQDKWGMRAGWNFGKNVAALLKRLHPSRLGEALNHETEQEGVRHGTA